MIYVTIKELKMAEELLHSQRLIKNIVDFDTKQTKFNCWNFTAFILQWTDELKWFNAFQMEELLKKNTKRVSKKNIQAGDIVVYRLGRGPNSLSHTAIIIDPINKIIIHKDGSSPVELSSIYEPYQWCRVSFRRVIK